MENWKKYSCIWKTFLIERMDLLSYKPMFSNQLENVLHIKSETKNIEFSKEDRICLTHPLRQHTSQGKAAENFFFSANPSCHSLFPLEGERKDWFGKGRDISESQTDPDITLSNTLHHVLLTRRSLSSHLLFFSLYRCGKLPPYVLSSSSAHEN